MPNKPFLHLNFYRDDGTISLAGKTLDFKGTTYLKKVLRWNQISQNLSVPPGSVQIANSTIEFEDTDGQVRSWFDDITPFRRLVDINLGWEEEAGNPPEPPSPIYTGRIDDVNSPLATTQVTLRDVIGHWADQEIPGLITSGVRDYVSGAPIFDLPSDIEWEFASIIFGTVNSYAGEGYDPQGVIRCPLVSTTLNRYCVARHSCYSVNNVYRKRPKANKFTVVPLSEYEIQEVTHNIWGIVYVFTYIQFYRRQEDGTVIHADVSGLHWTYNFETHTESTANLTTDPVDCIVALLYFLLQDEISLTRFKAEWFAETHNRTVNKQYHCQGAITADSNARKGITRQQALSRICSDFNIDFVQSPDGYIGVWLYDEELDQPVAALDANSILRMTMVTSLSQIRHYNRWVYRYHHQNAGLSDYIKSSNTGQWGFEHIIDNTVDQAELAATGENPLLTVERELHFVRDHNTAYNVTKRAIGYNALRSYVVDLQVPLPEFYNVIGLADSVTITHWAGFQEAGWTNRRFKVIGIVYDLSQYIMTLRVIQFYQPSDADLVSSYSLIFGDVEHIAVPRNPQFAVTVNATDDSPEPSDVSETVNLQTPDDPEDPMRTEYVPVNWREVAYEDVGETQPSWQRQVSGWVAKDDIRALLGSAGEGLRIIYGTLDPDTKPTDLTNDDIGIVLFYAIDFDHLYIWNGSEGDPPWVGLLYDGGNICWRVDPPSSPGWILCEGAEVTVSTYAGETALITVPALLGYMIKAAESLGDTGVEGTASLPTDNSSLPVCLASEPMPVYKLLPYYRM